MSRVLAFAVFACLIATSPSNTGYAQDRQSADEAAGESASGAGPAAGEAPPPKKKKKFRRSRLTVDEQEGLADRRKLLLNTGEEKTIDLEFDTEGTDQHITIGNPKVVARTLVKIGDRRQLVLKPLGPGETNLSVRDKEGNLRLILTVRVTASNLLRVAGEIRDLLRDVEGLNIRIVGPKVIIEGEVLVPADYGRLFNVISDDAYKAYVLNLTTVSPLALQVLAKKIQEDVNTFAPNARTRVVNGLIFLEGNVDTKDQADRAAKIALLYLPEVRPLGLMERDNSAQRLPQRPLIQNFLIINPPAPKKMERLVRVTVHFVELSKDYNKIFGFKWEPGFTSEPTINVGTGAAGQAGASGTSFSATISSLFPKLKSAQTAGYARVLKTGTVIVRSGQPDKIEQTTQIPYPQLGPNGIVTSNQAPVGLEVAVTPLILGQSEDIQLDLKMRQVSVTGRAPSANSPPITATQVVNTNVYVKTNESAAVAGMTTSDIGTNYNVDDPKQGSFDPSGGTDSLFSLIRSKSYRKNRNQFVIFVTPQIVENASDGTEDLKKNFRVKVK